MSSIGIHLLGKLVVNVCFVPGHLLVMKDIQPQPWWSSELEIQCDTC